MIIGPSAQLPPAHGIVADPSDVLPGSTGYWTGWRGDPGRRVTWSGWGSRASGSASRAGAVPGRIRRRAWQTAVGGEPGVAARRVPEDPRLRSRRRRHRAAVDLA